MKIDFKGINEYAKQLAELEADAEGICRYAIYDAAGLVMDAIIDNAPVDTGDLRESVDLSVMKNKDGFIYTQVIFEWYDRKGTPNSLKARAIESGTSRMQKRPFIRPAVNRVKKQAEQLIAKNLEAKIEEITNDIYFNKKH